jgi:hypothetical protein
MTVTQWSELHAQLLNSGDLVTQDEEKHYNDLTRELDTLLRDDISYDVIREEEQDDS